MFEIFWTVSLIKSPCMILNECNFSWKIVKYCILYEVCMIKTVPRSTLSPQMWCIKKKIKDWFARTQIHWPEFVNLSIAKNWAWFFATPYLLWSRAIIRGGEWYLEKRGSRKILAGSQTLGSVFDKSRSPVFSWFVFVFDKPRIIWCYKINMLHCLFAFGAGIWNFTWGNEAWYRCPWRNICFITWIGLFASI